MSEPVQCVAGEGIPNESAAVGTVWLIDGAVTIKTEDGLYTPPVEWLMHLEDFPNISLRYAIVTRVGGYHGMVKRGALRECACMVRRRERRATHHHARKAKGSGAPRPDGAPKLVERKRD